MFRKPLPDVRPSITRRNSIGRLKFIVTVSFFGAGSCEPAEIFVHVGKEGSTLGGLCSALGQVMSIALQYQVPWQDLAKHFHGAYFDPCGKSIDDSAEYRSIVDAIASTVERILEDRKRDIGAKDSILINLPPEAAKQFAESLRSGPIDQIVAGGESRLHPSGVAPAADTEQTSPDHRSSETLSPPGD